MSTQQGLRQASVRASTGTAGTYESDWEALFDAAGIPQAGGFNGRFLAWINVNLGTSYTEINGAMQALAVANGAVNFSSLGTISLALAITGTAAAGTVGSAYSWTPTISGGKPPYTVTVTVGSIPAWSALTSSTGNIAGASPTLGSVSFTLRATDSATPTPATADLPVTIVTSAALVLVGVPGTTASIGSAYSYTPSTTGGRGTIVWSIVNLPSWASFSTSTGALTGTPTGAETDTGINITATDADGRTVSTGAFTITVSAGGVGSALDWSDPNNSGLGFYMEQF